MPQSKENSREEKKKTRIESNASFHPRNAEEKTRSMSKPRTRNCIHKPSAPEKKKKKKKSVETRTEKEGEKL